MVGFHLNQGVETTFAESEKVPSVRHNVSDSPFEVTA